MKRVDGRSRSGHELALVSVSPAALATMVTGVQRSGLAGNGAPAKETVGCVLPHDEVPTVRKPGAETLPRLSVATRLSW